MGDRADPRLPGDERAPGRRRVQPHRGQRAEPGDHWVSCWIHCGRHRAFIADRLSRFARNRRAVADPPDRGTRAASRLALHIRSDECTFMFGKRSGRLQGEISVPASKYHAHRALMLASLAEGESRIRGGVAASHVQSTIEVLTGLGTQIETTADGFVVRGGLPYRPLRDTVSVGSSGTTLYFMIGLASLADAPVTITGQKYFQRRPVGPLLEALTATGDRARVGQRDAADHGPAEAPARRPGLDRRDAQPVDLRPDHRRAVRQRADNDRGRGDAERAPLRRTDREHDAGLRARGRGLRRLAPLRDRGRTRPPAPPTSPSPPTSARSPSASPPPRSTPPTSSSTASTRSTAPGSTTPRPTSSTSSPRWGCRWSSTARRAACGCATTGCGCAGSRSTAGRCPTCCRCSPPWASSPRARPASPTSPTCG